MRYVQCCGGLRECRTYELVPDSTYLLCQIERNQLCDVVIIIYDQYFLFCYHNFLLFKLCDRHARITLAKLCQMIIVDIAETLQMRMYRVS